MDDEIVVYKSCPDVLGATDLRQPLGTAPRDAALESPPKGALVVKTPREARQKPQGRTKGRSGFEAKLRRQVTTGLGGRLPSGLAKTSRCHRSLQIVQFTVSMLNGNE